MSFVTDFRTVLVPDVKSEAWNQTTKLIVI